jgi:hypothetical protein
MEEVAPLLTCIQALKGGRGVMLAVQLMFTIQLGTPRGRYDEYSSKIFPQ